MIKPKPATMEEIISVQRDLALETVDRGGEVVFVDTNGIITHLFPVNGADRRTGGDWRTKIFIDDPILTPRERARWIYYSSSLLKSSARQMVETAVAFLPLEVTELFGRAPASEDHSDVIAAMVAQSDDGMREGHRVDHAILAFPPMIVPGISADNPASKGDITETKILQMDHAAFKPLRLIVHSSTPPDMEVSLLVRHRRIVEWTPVGIFSERTLGLKMDMQIVVVGEEVTIQFRHENPEDVKVIAALMGIAINSIHAFTP